MKNRMRLRAAFDFCMQEKIKFFITVVEIIIFLCLAMQIAYMIAEAYSYKERILQGLTVSPEQLGSCYIESEESTEEIVQKVRAIPGILSYGSISGRMTNTCECLLFLGEIQKQGSLYQDDENEEIFDQGIITYCMSWDMLKIMNIKLTEGSLSDELIQQEQDIVLYLDEVYREAVQIGDVFYSVYNDRIVYRYIVGGFFTGNSAIMDELSTETLNGTGSLSLDYGIIEVTDCVLWEDGFFTFDSSTNFDQINRMIQQIAAEGGGSAEVYQVSSIIRYIEQNADKNTLYLKEAAVFLAVILILSVSAGQISDILTRTKDYGIWLSCGASKKDLAFFIVFQNIIRTGIAALISAALMFCVFRMIYAFGAGIESKNLVKLLYFKYVLPTELLLAVFVIFFSSFLPAGLIKKASSVNLIKGKVSG